MLSITHVGFATGFSNRLGWNFPVLTKTLLIPILSAPRMSVVISSPTTMTSLEAESEIIKCNFEEKLTWFAHNFRCLI